MSDWNYVAMAYGLTWAVLAGYAVHLMRRVRAARRSLEQATRGGEVAR